MTKLSSPEFFYRGAIFANSEWYGFPSALERQVSGFIRHCAKGSAAWILYFGHFYSEDGWV